MKINAVNGKNDELEKFTFEFHPEVVDFNYDIGEAVFSDSKYELTITNAAEYLNGRIVGLAMLSKDQAKLLYDSLGEFLNEDVS